MQTARPGGRIPATWRIVQLRGAVTMTGELPPSRVLSSSSSSIWKFTAGLIPALWCCGFISRFAVRHVASQCFAPATATMLCGITVWLAYLLVLGPFRRDLTYRLRGLYPAFMSSSLFMMPRRVEPWELSAMLTVGIPISLVVGIVIGLVVRAFARWDARCENESDRIEQVVPVEGPHDRPVEARRM